MIESNKLELNLRVLAAVAVSAVGMMMLDGCAATGASLSPNALAVNAVEGKVMGGETPISGATVILWQTDPATTSYTPTNAIKLATTTTGPGGGFSFPQNYTCTSGQFSYITATGGDVSNGGKIINNQQVQIAAIGSCSYFSSAAAEAKININVNEVSTVAAAYALGNFMNVIPSASGGQLVYIGAPSTNNAATGACTGLGSAMTCTAAGLAHAFANAYNLSDSVRYDGTSPTGAARVTIPGNAGGSVPQAQIHTLANILQTCTNTTGGASGDATPCGTLFAVATPPSGTAPTDELQAMLNIVRNPKRNVSSTTCATPATSIYCLAPGAGAAFQPQLAAAPSDWSLAVTYSGVTVGGTTTNITFPQALALDANDNVYFAAANFSAGASSSTLGSPATTNVIGMTSNGTGLWATGPNSAICLVGGMATDTAASPGPNVWMVNGPSSTTATNGCVYGINSYNLGTGAVTNSWGPAAVIAGAAAPGVTPVTTAATTGYGSQSQALLVAVDNLNNLWWGRKSTNCSTCLFENPYIPGGTTVTSTTTGSVPNGTVYYGAQTNVQTGMFSMIQLSFDQNDNIFAAGSNSAPVAAYTMKNITTGALTTANPATYTTTTPIPTNLAVTITPAAVGTGLGTLDGSGNFWVGSAGKLTEFTPAQEFVASSTGTITSVTSVVSSATSPSAPANGEVDGSGTLWYPSNTTSGQIWFTNLATNTSDYIYTCYAASGATSCAATGTTTAKPKLVQIDSTGSVWVPSTTTNYLVQIIGAAAPTFPQLSYAHPGVKP